MRLGLVILAYDFQGGNEGEMCADDLFGEGFLGEGFFTVRCRREYPVGLSGVRVRVLMQDYKCINFKN